MFKTTSRNSHTGLHTASKHKQHWLIMSDTHTSWDISTPYTNYLWIKSDKPRTPKWWTTADDLKHTPTLFSISLSLCSTLGLSLSLSLGTGGTCLFTFLSMRTVKTSRSLSGSRLRTKPWLNSCTGWFLWAVRFEFDKPISFPLRGCSSAAIFARAARCTTLRVVLRQLSAVCRHLVIGSRFCVYLLA